MQVKITIAEDGTIFVQRLNVMGGATGAAGLTVAVSPGETYHGYKHRRLRKLGNGCHELKRRKLPEDVPRN